MADFYSSYSAYKNYQPASLSAKDIKRFDEEIWEPGHFSKDHSCLELGSGTGLFLEYLAHKNVKDFQGLDHDDALLPVLRSAIRTHFTCQDVHAFLKENTSSRWDRIILLDVLEHFTPEEGFRLMTSLKEALNPRGKIVLKVPNGASPWGMNYQYGDLTHKTAFTSESLRQLATACDLQIDHIYDQRRGSRRRMITDKLVHKFLAWALLTPPPLWGANLYCVLALKD